MPDLPVDARDGPQGKPRRSEGGSDENAFDICFGCCPISAWISVFHPSVSHELEAKEKGRRRGRGCLVLPSFEISPLDIVSAAQTTACAKQIPLFLFFIFFFPFTLLPLQQVHGQAIYGWWYLQQHPTHVLKILPQTKLIFLISSAAHSKLNQLREQPPHPPWEPGPVSPDFYFLSCNLKFNGSAGDN